jgi:hypothetical protein
LQVADANLHCRLTGLAHLARWLFVFEQDSGVSAQPF